MINHLKHHLKDLFVRYLSIGSIKLQTAVRLIKIEVIFNSFYYLMLDPLEQLMPFIETMNVNQVRKLQKK